MKPSEKLLNWLDNSRWKYPFIGVGISFISSFLFSLSMMLPKNAITITVIVWVGVFTAGSLIFAVVQAIDEDVYKKRQTMLRDRAYRKEKEIN